jgi:hypothetical protein
MLKECGVRMWTGGVPQDRFQWMALVNMIMNRLP